MSNGHLLCKPIKVSEIIHFLLHAKTNEWISFDYRNPRKIVPFAHWFRCKFICMLMRSSRRSPSHCLWIAWIVAFFPWKIKTVNLCVARNIELNCFAQVLPFRAHALISITIMRSTEMATGLSGNWTHGNKWRDWNAFQAHAMLVFSSILLVS